MRQTPQDALLQWYEKDGRHHLPWRNTEDVYHIYISEIMLQQTQVKRVMEEYYPQFLSKFPTLEALANAKEEEVLAAWSGLGYYSRARNLHATAKLCSHTLPKTEKELLKLPGIGRYTASAIQSFAYHQNVGVVDTNIARVLKRYFALLDVGDAIVWQKAKAFVHLQYPTAHNQAMMDLGSLVCTPTNPKCEACPLTFTCKGKDAPELYTRKLKKSYETMELFYGVALQDEKIALKISNGPMYKGLLELPQVDPIEENFLGAFKHSYTKYRLTVKLYEISPVIDEVDWVDMQKAHSANISSLTRKALLHVRKRMGER